LEIIINVIGFSRMRVEDVLRMEVMKLKNMKHICLLVIVLLVAVIVISWIA